MGLRGCLSLMGACKVGALKVMTVDCPACETAVRDCSSAGRVHTEGPLRAGPWHKPAISCGEVGQGRSDITHACLRNPVLSIWWVWVWPGGNLSVGRAAVVAELRMLLSPHLMVEKKI